MSEDPALRRRSALLIAAGMGAAALGGCSAKPMPSNVPLSRASPSAAADVLLLEQLLLHERYAIAAYAAAAPLLPARVAAAAKQFLAHDLAHASELEGLIIQAGGKPAAAPARYEMGSPRGARELLELLHRAERAQLAAYLDAIPRLTPPRLRAAAAAILANDAQHLAILRSALALDPVPFPFVSGAE